MFRKHKISLVKFGLGTADDIGACGIKDLHEHVLEGGLAVLAVNVVSGGAAGDVEPIDLRRSIDGGEDLSAGGGSRAGVFESKHDVLASQVQVAGGPDVDLVLGLVTVEEVSHQVLLDVDSSDDDLFIGGGGWCRTSGGGGLLDELRVDLHKFSELDQRTGVSRGARTDRLDYGDARVEHIRGVCGGIDHPSIYIVTPGSDSSRHIGGLDSGVPVRSNGVPGELRVIGILRSREGRGDQSEKTEHVCKLVSKIGRAHV